MLVSAVTALYAGAIAILFVTDMPWFIVLPLALVVAILWWLFFAMSGIVPAVKLVERLLPRFNAAVWDNDNIWTLTTLDGDEVKAKLLATSFVHPQLTIVDLKLTGVPWYSRYRSLVLMQDNLDEEIFRRLRVRLRWYSSPEQNSSAVLK